MSNKPTPAPETEPKPPGKFRRVLFRGLVALLPTIATIALLALLFDFFYRYFANPVSMALAWLFERLNVGSNLVKEYPNLSQAILAIAGFLLSLALVAALGLLLHGLVGRRLLSWLEKGLLQLPVVRAIYPYTKQIVEFFFDKKRPAFQSVVAVPYPSPEIYSIAFVTSEGMKSLNEKTQKKLVSVFIPSSPVPMTGWVAFIPAEKVIPLSIHVDDALRLMVSAGLILPESEKTRLPEAKTLS